MAGFCPERLITARRRRGLSKTELAELAGVSSRIISDHEAGKKKPTPETIARFSAALRFPESFFCLDRIDLMESGSVSFRSLTAMTAWQRDAALAACSLALELNAWIESRFKLVSPDLPDMSKLEPEDAAIELRSLWGRGTLPITNMIHLLERHGVRVFSLSEQSRELDAFSFWKDDKPFCLLNTQKSAEHSRFDAAHELFHLIAHRHGAPSGRDAERQADAFASAFLMPRETVLARIRRAPIRRDLIRAKHFWHVSLAALANRCHRLGLLSDWQYRGLCIEMGQRCERTTEPEPMPVRETSQVLAKVFGALREEGIPRSKVAVELGLHTEDLDALIFGLVFLDVEGGGKAAPSVRPPLRLITS